MILDLHAAPGGQGYDEGISDYDPNFPSLWESSKNKNKTVELWGKLAERYKNKEFYYVFSILSFCHIVLFRLGLWKMDIYLDLKFNFNILHFWGRVKII